MKNMFTIEHAGEKVCFEKPENGLVMIQVSTQGPALGGGAFVYALTNRSEERRVGKECRSRWSPYH